MTEYHNWPNLKLTYLTNLGTKDYWGLPTQDVYTVRLVCQRSLQALNNQDRLTRKSIQERFPQATDISLVGIEWLKKPLGRPSFGAEDESAQLDFPF